jgi:filamentous hemagglutinin family protein
MNRLPLHHQPRCVHFLRPNPMALAVTLALASANTALALPTGEEVVAGQVATSRTDARNLVVQQHTPKAIVNWNTFSIQGNETVAFQQPTQSSVILNRVTGANPSDIFGTLKSNGNVFLVNPNGILFGPTASVQVGGLVASTLSISNEDFLAGKYQFTSTTRAAAVKNQANITARESSIVALLGGKVENDGTVHARLGTAALAAGGKVALDFSDDGLTKIRVDQAALDAQIRNGGLVVADGGQVVMTVAAAEALGRTVVNQEGIVRATSVNDRTGKVTIDGGASGVTLVSGTVDASGLHGNEKGGEIQILGQHIGVVKEARIDASGSQGGGRVLAGGSFQGRDPQARHGQATFLGPKATIDASATDTGDGGLIVLWSDGATRAYGTMSSRGGAKSGAGGTIETSGKYLDVRGVRVSAEASSGKQGTWLVDPNDIRVTVFCFEEGGCTEDQHINGDANFTSTNDNAVITPLTIERVLNTGTNVTVSTSANGTNAQSGDINIERSIAKTGGGRASLTFNAHRNIEIEEEVTIQSTTGPLDLALNTTDGDVRLDTASKFVTNGGNVVIRGKNLTLSSSIIDTSGGEVLLDNMASPLGNIDLFGGVKISSKGGRIQLLGGEINLTNTILDTSGGPSGTNDSVTISGRAGRDESSNFTVELLDSSVVTSRGAIVLSGRALGGDQDDGGGGILLQGASSISSRAGRIEIEGSGVGETNLGDGSIGPRGVMIQGASIGTTEGGSITIAGRATSSSGAVSSARAIDLVSGKIETSGSSPGSITISGEAAIDDTGLGGLTDTGGSTLSSITISAEATIANTGLEIGPSFTIGQTDSHTNIALGALNGGAGDSIVLAGKIQTKGGVTLSPAAVTATVDGIQATSANTIPIRIGGEDSSGFALSPEDLQTILPGANGVIIGGANHVGSITVGSDIVLQNPLTLQNGGAGSNGIRIDGALDLGSQMLLLSSGGAVTQTFPVSASQFLLHGTQPESRFNLTHPSNTVSQLSAFFETPKAPVTLDSSGVLQNQLAGTLKFENSRTLAISPLTGVLEAKDGSIGSINTLTLGTVVAGDIFARTHSGDLSLEQPIRTLGSDITLVSKGVFTNKGGNLLSPGGGGKWRIWADTWKGGDQGPLVATNPRPNWYNCAFQGACGVTLPADGNRFIYREQPPLIISTPDRTIQFGSSIPLFPPAVNGLVNGDVAMPDMVQGSFRTTATANSEPGTYDVTGTFASPSIVGYTITSAPAKLTITPDSTGPICTTCALPPTPSLNMCTASGPLLIRLQDPPPDAKTVDTEWTRVRTRLNLGNCLGVNPRAACDDF